MICRSTISLDVIANLPTSASRTSLAAGNDSPIPDLLEKGSRHKPDMHSPCRLKVGSNEGSLNRENFEPCFLNTVSCFASPSGMRDAEKRQGSVCLSAQTWQGPPE